MSSPHRVVKHHSPATMTHSNTHTELFTRKTHPGIKSPVFTGVSVHRHDWLNVQLLFSLEDGLITCDSKPQPSNHTIGLSGVSSPNLKPSLYHELSKNHHESLCWQKLDIKCGLRGLL